MACMKLHLLIEAAVTAALRLGEPLSGTVPFEKPWAGYDYIPAK